MSSCFSAITDCAIDLFSNVTTCPSYWAAGSIVAALTAGTGLWYLSKKASTQKGSEEAYTGTVKDFYNQKRTKLNDLCKEGGYEDLTSAFKDPTSSVVLWTDATVNSILKEAQDTWNAQQKSSTSIEPPSKGQIANETQYAVMDSLLRNVGEYGVPEWVKSWHRGRTSEGVSDVKSRVRLAEAMRERGHVKKMRAVLES